MNRVKVVRLGGYGFGAGRARGTTLAAGKKGDPPIANSWPAPAGSLEGAARGIERTQAGFAPVGEPDRKDLPSDETEVSMS